MSRHWLAPILIGLALWGCSPRVTNYRIQIHCTLPDGEPVSGVEISSEPGGKPLLHSDAQGRMVLAVKGREGQEVSFAIVRVPPTLTLAGGREVRKVILKNVGTGAERGVSELQHEISLRPKKETYVVLVTAKQAPNVKIAANNSEVATLNSESAAAFRIEGTPGDELKVKILASKTKRVQGPDPEASFQLPERGDILTFPSTLFIKPEIKKPPKVRGPSGVKVIPWKQMSAK